MRKTYTPFRLLTRCLRWCLVLAATASLPVQAWGAELPANAANSLANALNPDGSLRAGATGSFSAEGYRAQVSRTGQLVFSPAGTAGTGDEKWLQISQNNGTNGSVNAMAIAPNGDIYVGGNFSVAGNTAAANIAKWNGTTWSVLGGGVAGQVSDLAIASNGDLYVAGRFAMAGGVAVGNVARWNGATWTALGAGVAGGVSALALASNGDLYAAGNFETAGGQPAQNIAKWNGAAWSALGTGLAGVIYNFGVTDLALAANGYLYAAGVFTTAGGTAVGNMAKWDGTSWSGLGAGLNGRVNKLAVAANGEVYVGGYFTAAGNVPASKIARWNGTAWSSIGAIIGPQTPYYDYVGSLAIAATGELYVSGQFHEAGGVAVNNMARWNGTTWSPLGSGLTPTVYGDAQVAGVLAVAATGEVYAGGNFTIIGGVVANYVAKWNGNIWNSLGISNQLNNVVYAVAVASNGDVYASGLFTAAGQQLIKGIARWNGTGWSALGSGGVAGIVRVLRFASNGDLYVGGYFTSIGGLAVDAVARWNGTAWSNFAPGLSGSVNGLVIDGNGDVYVGGDFIYVNGVGSGYVAKWNGTNWNTLGTGVARPVYSLAIAGNGNVYASSAFTSVYSSQQSNNFVSVWDGATWTRLGDGFDDAVWSLAVAANGDLYAGGNFTQTSGVAVLGIARWTGTAWAGVGSGLGVSGRPASVGSLVVRGSNVYAGGRFRMPGTTAYANIAKWDGSTWSTLGSGLNNSVQAIAVAGNGDVVAGGAFTAVGDNSKRVTYFTIYQNAVVSSMVPASSRPALALFPNPAPGVATLQLAGAGQARTVQLLDALGRLVHSQPLPAGAISTVLELRGLSAGSYIVRCGSLSTHLSVE